MAEQEAEEIEVKTLAELREKLLDLCQQHRHRISGFYPAHKEGSNHRGLEVKIDDTKMYYLINDNITTMYGFLDRLLEDKLVATSFEGCYSLLPENVIEYAQKQQRQIKRAIKERLWDIFKLLLAALLSCVVTLITVSVTRKYTDADIAAIETRVQKLEHVSPSTKPITIPNKP